MDFMSSKTAINLARAFAGECQAKNRYEFYAEKADREGLQYLAGIIKEIARNEQAHSKVFFEHIVKNAGAPVNNIAVNAGYPAKLGTTADNMKYAAEAEHDESSFIYPEFEQIARQEGYPEIAASFALIAKVEGEHEKIFNTLFTKLSDGSLYKSQAPKQWKCSVCGHTHTGTEAWAVCPLCAHAGGFVEIDISQ